LDYLREASLEALTAQHLARRDNGNPSCRIQVSRIAPGHSSPAGFHIHEVDQYYYILTGELKVEIAREIYKEGEEIVADIYTAKPNTLIIFPKGVPHRNWNDTAEPVYHIGLLVPEPAVGTIESITIA
jgi:mannose-6-phosphate isomerase-like protein (cupin superfamily)